MWSTGKKEEEIRRIFVYQWWTTYIPRRQNVRKDSVQGNTNICFVFRKNAIEKILSKVSEMLNGARLFQEKRNKPLNLF